VWNGRTDLEQRLLANTCELCDSHQRVEVHHIRALRNLTKRGQAEKSAWVRAMATRRRKTLVVCRTCHMDIQHGRPLQRVGQTGQRSTGELDALKRARPVRRGAVGKGPTSGTSLAAYPTADTNSSRNAHTAWPALVATTTSQRTRRMC